MKTQSTDEPHMLQEIIDAFEQEFYVPLFEASNVSLYDYLQRLDRSRYQSVGWNRREFVEAALLEHRFADALFCLQCTLVQRSPLPKSELGCNPQTGQQREIEDLIPYLTDEVLAQIVASGNPTDIRLVKHYEEIKEKVPSQT